MISGMISRDFDRNDPTDLSRYLGLGYTHIWNFGTDQREWLNDKQLPWIEYSLNPEADPAHGVPGEPAAYDPNWYGRAYYDDELEWDDLSNDGSGHGSAKVCDAAARISKLHEDYKPKAQTASPIFVRAIHPNSPDSLVSTARAFTYAVDPDVLASDFYPCLNGPGSSQINFEGHLRNLDRIRVGAGDRPYWMWVQSFRDGARRFPGESEMRLMMFLPLAIGYTGLLDFRYQGESPNDLVLEPTSPNTIIQTPRQPFYNQKAKIIDEVKKLGRSLSQLRCLTWARYDNLDVLGNGIRSISAKRQSTGQSLEAFLVISVFCDDNERGSGASYFMVANMFSGESIDGASGLAVVDLVLDSPSPQLQEVWRNDGQVHLIDLQPAGTPGRYSHTFTLPGGTANLYKLNNGQHFAGF
jgi:hypothetical protein